MNTERAGPGRLRRRELLARGGLWVTLLALGLSENALSAQVQDELAFDSTSLDSALTAMGGLQASSQDIALALPEVVEDGAFVAVSVSSALPGTREISIVVEHNPNPLVVQFTLPEGTEPYVSTRVKVAESGRVFAIVRADGKVYSTCRSVQVQRGGC
jgi:sulfur-oxidizing protein SoxY